MLDAKGTPLTGRLLVWSSTESAVATVSASGVLTAAPNRGAAPLTTTVSAQSEGKVGQATVTVTPAPVARVVLTPDSSTVGVGATLQLAVAVQDAEGAPLAGRTITYRSLDTTVATISTAGLVTAASYTGPAARTVRVVATAESLADTTALVVTPLGVASVTLGVDSVALMAGTTRALTAVVRDAAGMVLTGRPVTWSATETTVATVSSAGLVEAVAYSGPATRLARVIAAAAGKADTAAVTVTPVPVGRVVASLDSVVVTAGGDTTLAVVVTDSVGGLLTGRPVTWTSTDTSVINVNATGALTAGLTAGPYLGGLTRSARVIATSAGRADTARVAVRPMPVAQLTVIGIPADSGLLRGDSLALTATPRNAAGAALTGRTLTWTSSAPTVATVATVAGTGRVTAIAGGSAVVTVASEGVSVATPLLVREPVTVPPPSATEPVTTTALGGAVEMTVPPGATTVAALTVAPAPTAPTDDRVLPGAAYVFGPPGTTFTTPVTVALRFDPADVPAEKREKLRVALVTPDGLSEVPGGEVDLVTNQVLAEVRHFSTYTIVVPPTPASVRVTAGDGQEAEIGTVVATAPAVQVVDVRGRPISRERVRFAVGSGGGTLSDTASVVTDTLGRAVMTGRWTLGRLPGPQTLTVTVLGTGITVTVTVIGRRVPVASVTVTPGSATLAVGATTALTALRRAATGDTLVGDAVTWRTSDAAVATVVGLGGDADSARVTAVRPGTATITATTTGPGGPRSGTATITVLAPVANVVVSPATATLAVGATQQLTAEPRDAAGTALTGRVLAWSSADTSIATVSGTGLVTARPYAGSATRTVEITATSEGRSGTATLTVTPAPVATVAVSPATVTLVVGTTQALTAVLQDAGGTVLSDRTITWTTSDASVATVAGTGGNSALVLTPAYTGGATRTVTITATSGGRAATVSVTVTPVPVATLRVSPATATVAIGSTLVLTTVLSDADGAPLTGRSIAWTSADTTVATVASSGPSTGSVTAVPYAGPATRTVTITASSEGKSATAILTVPPRPVAGVAVTPTTLTVAVGTSQSLTAVLTATGGAVLTGRVVTWASSDTSVATVNAAGLVTARPYTGNTTRTVTVTATSEGKSGTATVTVSPVAVASVVVSPDTATVAVGGTRQLAAQPRDAAGVSLSGRVVTWASSDTSVVTVSTAGLVTVRPYAGGATRTVVITAASEGRSGTATITVPPVPVASVVVSPDTATVAVSATRQLVAEPRDAAGTALTGRVVTWSSADTSVATVSGAGLVSIRPYAGGASRTVAITATSEGRSGTATVTVPPVAVATVVVSPDTATVAVGATRQLAAEPRDAAGTVLTGRVVTWSSADTTIATIAATGLVTVRPYVGGVQRIVTITAMVEGRTGTMSLTVPPSPFAVAANGVTITCSSATIGQTGVIDGITYTKRSRAQLDSLVAAGNAVELARSCTSGIADLSYLFAGARDLNPAIGSWDVSAVTTMRGMFSGASAFSQPLAAWNVGNVTTMFGMFEEATIFNQPLATWDVSHVTSMEGMFRRARAFDQPLATWNVGAVTNMMRMFDGATVFNRPIGTWNTGAVTSMSWMFAEASAFNQDISAWNVSNVTTIFGMFEDATVFNQPLATWDVSNVTSMEGMFRRARAFNQPLDAWNVGAVTNMVRMFDGATLFNRPIGTWNTAAVTSMSSMFAEASAFNQDIGTWNVGAVVNMDYMFVRATAFNGNLGGWCVSGIPAAPTDFDGGASSWTLSRPVWGSCPQPVSLTGTLLVLRGADASSAEHRAVTMGGTVSSPVAGSENSLFTGGLWGNLLAGGTVVIGTSAPFSEIVVRRNAPGWSAATVLGGAFRNYGVRVGRTEQRMTWFRELVGGGDAREIWIANTDGSAAAQLTSNGEMDNTPDLSPDNGTIVWAAVRSGASNIWLMNADGTNPRQLTTGGGAGLPRFSPDGARIAFVGTVSGQSTLMVMNADGSGQREVPGTRGLVHPGLAGEVAPFWSPTGDVIVFNGLVSGSPVGIYFVRANGTGTATRFRNNTTAEAAYDWRWPVTVGVAAVSVSPDTATIGVGGTRQLTAATLDVAGTSLPGRSVTWSSSNAAVATMSSTGVVTAVAAGTATITASSEGRSATAVITVTAPVGTAYRNTNAGLIPGEPDSIRVASPNPTLVAQFNFDITGPFDYTSPVLAEGKAYRIRISGRGGVGPLDGSNYQNSMSDAAFYFCGFFQNLDTCQVKGDGLNWPPGWDGIAGRRPSPDAYTTTHVYDYYIRGPGRGLTWTFRDNPYGDNRGDFVVQIHLLGDIVGTGTPPAAVAALTLDATSATLAIGGTRQITATLTDASGATLTGRTVTWSSSDTTIVRVSATGLATAVAAGTATITASSEGRSATAVITVTAPVGTAYRNTNAGLIAGEPDSIRVASPNPTLVAQFNFDITRPFDYTSPVLAEGKAYRIRVSGRGGVGPLDGTNYQNSMPDAAYWFCGYFQNLDTCQVEGGGGNWPPGWDGITGRRPSPDGYTTTHVYDYYIRGAGRGLTWTFRDNPYSDNRGDFVVQIHLLGEIVGTGTPPSAVAAVTLDATSATLAIGGTRQLTATLTDAGGTTLTGRTVTWSSSDLAVATVSNAGLVTAVAAGTTTITASSEGKAALSNVIVSVPSALLAAYPLTLGTTTDVSGNNNALLLTGGRWVEDRFGVDSSAIEFDGVAGGLVTADSILSLGSPEYTIALWFSRADYAVWGGWAEGVIGTNPHTGIGFGFDHNVPGASSLALGDGLTFWKLLYNRGSKTDWLTNNWYHVALRKSGTRYQVYLDGALAHDVDVPSASTYIKRAMLSFGANWKEFQVSKGKIDDIRVYTRALTFAEIQQQSSDRGLRPVAAITVTPTSAAVTVGQAQQLSAVVKDSIGSVLTGRAVLWSSSDTAIARVSSTGLATASPYTGSATRTAIITAISETKSATATVTVTPAGVATIRVSPDTRVLYVGEKLQLSAEALGADGATLPGRSISWTSLAPTVLSISASGEVTAVAIGTGSAAATSDGVFGSASIRVVAEQSVTTDPRYPTNAVDAGYPADCRMGYDCSGFWSNLDGVKADDASFASVPMPRQSTGCYNCTISRWLHTTGYGFTIPSGSEIKGVKVEVIGNSGGPAVIEYAHLLKGNTRSSEGKRQQLDGYGTLGGGTSLWGESWTPADINNTQFGVGLTMRNIWDKSYTAYVHYVRISVTFVPPSSSITY